METQELKKINLNEYITDDDIFTLKQDLANFISNNIALTGIKSCYKFTYNEKDLQKLLDFYKNKKGHDYTHLKKLNESLIYFTQQSNGYFCELAYSSFYYVCEEFAEDVIYEICNIKFGG